MTDREGRLNAFSWLTFFNRIAAGDTGVAWTPTFVSLTETGTPTITGYYYKISQRLAYFRVKVTPATDTSAVAGTTYISNFPLVINQDGQCSASAGVAGSLEVGSVDADTGRIYVPAWTAVTVPVTITGTIEAR